MQFQTDSVEMDVKPVIIAISGEGDTIEASTFQLILNYIRLN